MVTASGEIEETQHTGKNSDERLCLPRNSDSTSLNIQDYWRKGHYSDSTDFDTKSLPPAYEIQ